ncbi:nicotinate phosphoribosyltransferase [compost metagenome]
MLEPVFQNGELIAALPDLEDIRNYHQTQLALFWPEYLRKLNPEKYPVDLSVKVWELQKELIRRFLPH